MEEKEPSQKSPDPERLEALKRMPKEILQALTREEVDAFLHDDVWPDSLRKKLKDFVVD